MYTFKYDIYHTDKKWYDDIWNIWNTLHDNYYTNKILQINNLNKTDSDYLHRSKHQLPKIKIIECKKNSLYI